MVAEEAKFEPRTVGGAREQAGQCVQQHQYVREDCQQVPTS